ncbi:MAG: DotU family type IV/VI secretion system protein, partial [Deltaproteobacteria bacterium]|nr:DotU family type IV/VI secretion system protein [Deltaproteobacteria bacterium]
FFKIFHYVLDTSFQEGEALTPWPDVYATINKLAKTEETRLLPPGFSPSDRRDTMTPILLWVDEALLNCKRPDAAKWYDYSLQREFYGTNQGGELFFNKLEDLLRRRIENFEAPTFPDQAINNPSGPVGRMAKLWVNPGQGPDPLESQLDAYSLCLVLGYKGMLVNDSPDALNPIKDLARQQLASWGPQGEQERPKKDHQSFLSILAKYWRHYGWIAVYLAIPATLTFLLWRYYKVVVNSLPF